MKRKIAVLLVVLAFAAFTQLAETPSLNIVKTESGDLEGEQQDGLRIFKGVPYAAAPVGGLRWRGPVRPIKWTGVRKADKFGAACTQPDFEKVSGSKPVGGILSGAAWVLWTNVPSAPGTSEDCLFLNIWAPLHTPRAPVMVFIHGGGGSGAVPV